MHWVSHLCTKPPYLLKLFFSKADRCHQLLSTATGIWAANTTNATTATTTTAKHHHRLLLLLSLCSDPKHLYQTHGFMIRNGLLDHNILLLSRFIDACFSLGLSEYGYLAFTHNKKTAFKSNPPPQNIIYLFNAMIKALSRQPHSAKDAILLFNDIRLVPGLRPDSYSFPFALKAVLRLSSIQLGRQIHCQALGSGLDSDVHVSTALIQMYASCREGCVVDAPEAVRWNVR